MNEMGKKERLRNGEAVELKPGIFGRLNKEKRSLELDSGKVLPIGKEDQRDLFPENEQSLDVARRTEKLEGQVKKAPFGEFLHQFGQSGVLSAPKNWLDYLTKSGDQYLAQRQAQNRVSNRISNESPVTSGAATIASFAPDLALTSGMSALKAAPALTAIQAGPRILEEPGQVAGEAALAAGGGYLIDKGAKALNNIAQRRAQSRALPAQKQAVNEANKLQNEQFNALKQNTKGVNESRLKQHQEDLNKRQNTIIQEQNAYEQRKLQRDTEIIRLKNKAEMEKSQRAETAAQSEAEYRAAKSIADQENKRMTDKFKQDQIEYQKALAQLPELQKKAQQEYSANVIKNAESISNAFPKESKIFSDQFGVGNFIEESIEKSGRAGTREANQSARVLNSLFPEGEILTASELVSRYKSLEEAIQRATPEVREILNEFKNHLGDRLPTILSDNMAYNRIVPTLKRQIEREVLSVLDSMAIAESGLSSRAYLKSRAKSNINQLFNELSAQDFINKMQSGEIRQQILKSVMSPKDFSVETRGINVRNPAQNKFDEFNNFFTNKLDKALAQAELKMLAIESDAAKKLGAKVRNTYGIAEPVSPPNAPIAPEHVSSPSPPVELPPIAPSQLPPLVAPPQVPPMPGKPPLMPEPIPPVPMAEPTLPQAQGISERIGDLLEKPLLGNNGNGLDNNNLLKLGGLKYLLGKAAIPAEAAYLGMNALTSPRAGGQIARMTFKQGGIKAVDTWARKYSSYRNGILENPQERRSLTKEVEDDPEIPIEQKAIIQSKINRGKNLEERL